MRNVIIATLFVLCLSPIASAKGGFSPLHRSTNYTTVRNEVIFQVTPQTLQLAMKLFLEKYPKNSQCGYWSYSYESQYYRAGCGDGVNKNYRDYIDVTVRMDGSITAIDRSDWKEEKIGVWSN